MTKTAKLMPLTDDALSTVSGARHCHKHEGEHRGWFPGFGKLTSQFSGIENVVIIVGNDNTVTINNTVSQKA